MLWMRISTSFYRRAWLMVRDLADVEDTTTRLPVRIAPLAREEAGAYRHFRPQAPGAQLEQRFARGDVAFVAWLGDRIVHAAWVATGRVHVAYLGRDLLLQPHELLIYDSHTLPDFRGSGMSRARMMQVFQHYRERGYERCLAVVALENVVGRRVLESGGYRIAGRYGCLRFGRWRRCWRDSSSDATVPELSMPLHD